MYLFRLTLSAVLLASILGLFTSPLLAATERGGIVIHPDAAKASVASEAPSSAPTGRIVVNEIPPADSPATASAAAQPTGRIVINDSPPAEPRSDATRGVDTPFSVSIASQVDTSAPFTSPEYAADGSFTIQVVDGSCTTATYTVQASPVANSAPDGTTPPSTTITAYIGFGDGSFLFSNAGAGQYAVTVTETSGGCSFDAGVNPINLTVTIQQGVADPPFGLAIETQVDTTRPFAAPDYAPDGSFRMRITDPATCTGVYTVSASPVAGSGPGSSTPPLTTVTAYIGFGQGTVYFFDNAGVGDYTVTATETGADCAYAAGDEQQVLIVTVDQGPFDTPYTLAIDSQVNTSLPFNDPGYVADGSFTMAIGDGSCAGTYTINASPVAGSGPGGSTPPSTTVVTYIGFPEGTFLFGNAGVGDYTVTVNETGVCTFDPPDPRTTTVTVSANQPVLGFAPNPLDFGDVEMGTVSAAANVTLSNSGTAQLSVSSVTAAAAPFAAAGGSCGAAPFTIPVGGSCTLAYTFAPAAIGPASATITVESTATPAMQSFGLAGTGVQASLVLDTSLLLLGPVASGQLDIGTVTVSSSGSADLNISDITMPAAPFSLSGGDCLPVPTTVPSGSSCTIEVRFDPGAVPGSFTSSFDIVSNAVSSPDTVDLQGTADDAVPVPTLERWGLIALALMLMLAAGLALRGRAT